jgi:hypothetical protein
MDIRIHQILSACGLTLLSLILIGALVWGSFALWFQGQQAPWAKVLIITLWVVLGLFCLWRIWVADSVLPPLAVFAVLLAALLAWWGTIKPSNNRIWADDVAYVLQPVVKGDLVTLNRVRNFNWRTPTDYDLRWESRTYDLRKLVSADLLLSYWMGPSVAHTLVSFGFEDGSHVVFSLEIRKERGEKFSAIGGFFREFEVVMIAADERDIVRVRSNVRGEQVYLYRLHVPQEDLRKMFLNYVDEANGLINTPTFYNTLTSNCTTIVYDLARRISPTLPLDYRLVLSGYLAEYAQDAKVLTPDVDFKTLKERGFINPRAIAAGNDPQFSTLIRQGVPGIPTTPTEGGAK